MVGLTWVAAVHQINREHDQAIADAVGTNNNLVSVFEQHVIRMLDAAEATARDIADESREGLVTGSLPRVIEDPSVSNDMFSAVSIIDAEGDVVAASVPLAGNINVAQEPYFRQHVLTDSNEAYVGRPVLSPLTGEPGIMATWRIDDQEGDFAGVVSVELHPRQFTRFFRHAAIRPGDLLSVIGLDGVTRARRQGATYSYGEDVSGTLVMRMQMRNPNGTYAGPSVLDGIVRYFTHRRIPQYNLFVTVGAAREDLLAPSMVRERKYYLAATLISIMGIAFAWLLIVNLFRRQRASDALADAVMRLREAQKIGRIGDWEMDIQTGKITWSDELYNLYERDPSLGAPSYGELFRHFDDQSKITVQRAVDLVLATGEPQTYEIRAIMPSGRVSYQLTNAVPTTDSSGKVVRIHGTDQDISARKLLEILQAEVAHLSRIDAMNTMAATLAHEINQPLTAATNYLVGSKRLLSRIDAPEMETLLQGMKGAEQQILLAGNIIRRIRDMVSDRPSRYDYAPLSEIINDALSLVTMANDYPNVEIHKALDPEADIVTADRVQIQQVLINLVRNACDAIADQPEPRVRIASERIEGDKIRICVTDNGPGIAESMGDLFSPFATSKEQGLGLGLSISRTIVEAHGGRIWVEQSGETGTTICFTIPALNEMDEV